METKTVLKFFLISISILFLIVAYKLLFSNQISSRSDCLKLGSDFRATQCLQEWDNKHPQVIETRDKFPLYSIEISDVKANINYGYINVLGTVYNKSDYELTNLFLRINFTKIKDSSDFFHYQTFAPFNPVETRVQPHSKKSFEATLNSNTYNVLKDINQWYFNIVPFDGEIF